LDLGGGVTIHTGTSNQADNKDALEVSAKIGVSFVKNSVTVLTS
jgi:hypothetical protein